MAKTDSRVAVVTGASRGIGKSIAERLGADGFHMVLVARDEKRLDEVVSAIHAAGGSAETRVCDLADTEAVDTLMTSILDAHGRLDVLVNNAGINRDGLILRMSDEDFDDVMNVNLKAAFVTCRAVARPMMRGRWGRIINIGSVTGLVGNPGQANYAAAKAGINAYAKALAVELGRSGVRANVVCPGSIRTAAWDHRLEKNPDILGKLKRLYPLGRIVNAKEVAEAVAFLASERASGITGVVMPVDAGLTAGYLPFIDDILGG